MHTTASITIAPWLHEDAGIASDPINLLFAVANGSDPLGTVISDLQPAGWTTTTMGDHQYLYYNDTRVQEIYQYEKSPSWFPSPPGLGKILFRYHLRLWYEPNLDSRVIGGVHLEIFSNGHEIISFDEAKREIARDFKNCSWSVTHDGAQMDNHWLDSRNLSMSARLLNAIGRRDQRALARFNSLRKSTRDRFLSNGYATLIER